MQTSQILSKKQTRRLIIGIVIMTGIIIPVHFLSNHITNPRTQEEILIQRINAWKPAPLPKNTTYTLENQTFSPEINSWQYKAPERTFSLFQYPDARPPHEHAATTLATVKNLPGHSLIRIMQNPIFAILKTNDTTNEIIIWKYDNIHGKTWANATTFKFKTPHETKIFMDTQLDKILKRIDEENLITTPTPKPR
jgi:hypothetical protein